MAIKNLGMYSLSDLEFIHLLAKRGLSFKYSKMVIDEERLLKHSNGNLSSILKVFCIVAKISEIKVKKSRDRRSVWVKHMFCYYCRENTDISSKLIMEYVNLYNFNLKYATDSIKNDLSIGYKPTIEFIKQVKKETLKTR